MKIKPSRDSHLNFDGDAESLLKEEWGNLDFYNAIAASNYISIDIFPEDAKDDLSKGHCQKLIWHIYSISPLSKIDVNIHEVLYLNFKNCQNNSIISSPEPQSKENDLKNIINILKLKKDFETNYI